MRDVETIQAEAARLTEEGRELRARLLAWQRETRALLDETHDATLTEGADHDAEFSRFLGLEGDGADFDLIDLNGDLNGGRDDVSLDAD